MGAGAIRGIIGLTQDYRGRAREVFGSSGMVAADHGRCSDMGEESLGTSCGTVFVIFL